MATRASLERDRTIVVWRRHLQRHGHRFPLTCICEFQPGRFRKGQRVGGCGRPRCYTCHAEKLFGTPSRQESRINISHQEWLKQMTYQSVG